MDRVARRTNVGRGPSAEADGAGLPGEKKSQGAALLRRPQGAQHSVRDGKGHPLFVARPLEGVGARAMATRAEAGPVQVFSNRLRRVGGRSCKPSECRRG